MATMHDVLDAQWMYDNYKDGENRFTDRRLMFWKNLFIVEEKVGVLDGLC